MNTDWHDLIQRHIAGLTTDEEATVLHNSLKQDDVLARLYLRYMNLDVALEAHAGSQAVVTEMLASPQRSESKRWTNWLSWRPLTAAAAGIVLGLFSATVVFAYALPRAVTTVSRLLAMVDGGFENQRGRLPSGFPMTFAVWSGDEAEVVSHEAKDGRQVLRFVSPMADAADPSARAISCDVFQIVDLRSLHHAISIEGESFLELSANFLDARPQSTEPSITFFCQLYLFRGDPTVLHQSWPQVIPEALSSGSAQITSLGGSAVIWKPLTAKSMFPADADFAVIQIAARPNQRPAKLDSLFADDVRLTLKTQPSLPVRIVQK